MFSLKHGMSWKSDLRTIGKHLSSHLRSIFSLGQEIWWPHVPKGVGHQALHDIHPLPSPLSLLQWVLLLRQGGKGEESLVTITISSSQVCSHQAQETARSNCQIWGIWGNLSEFQIWQTSNKRNISAPKIFHCQWTDVTREEMEDLMWNKCMILMVIH